MSQWSPLWRQGRSRPPCGGWRGGERGGGGVPEGTASRLKTEVVRNEPVVAPVAAGQQLATLRVLAGEQTVAEVPLGALDRVEQAGILGRAWDGIRLWIR